MIPEPNLKGFVFIKVLKSIDNFSYDQEYFTYFAFIYFLEKLSCYLRIVFIFSLMQKLKHYMKKILLLLFD